MAKYDIKLNSQEVVDLLSNNEQFSSLVENILNQILQAEMTEYLGVESYERDDNRNGYRNGCRIRKFATRIGKLVLRVPKNREGGFSTELFKRYQRSEQAFVLGLMQMYLQGVSTRRVKKVTEELCGVSFSHETVSQLVHSIDYQVKAWRDRKLDKSYYPFLIVDALLIDVRDEKGAVRSGSVLIAYGVNNAGHREILGIYIDDSESEQSWTRMFEHLKSRGLKRVDLIVSDNHGGLVKAAKKLYQNSMWQRCQVHFMRNVLGSVKHSLKAEVALKLKDILHSSDKQLALELANKFIAEYEDKAQNAVKCFENGIHDALTVMDLPPIYRKKLRTTNLAERVNEEIRHREKIIRIFPNRQSALIIIGAILMEKHEQWVSGKRYLDMTEYEIFKESSASELRVA